MVTSVLVLTPWFPNRPGDRTGSFVHDSAVALSRQGLSVTVLIARPWTPRVLERRRLDWLTDEFEPGSFVSLNEVRLVHYLSVPRNFMRCFSTRSHDARVGPVLETLVSRHRVDLIHAHTESEASIAARAGKRANIPVVVTLHGINPAPRYFGSPAQRRKFKAALCAVDRVLLVGEPLRPFFRDVAGRDEHFRVVPNGVALPPAKPRTRLNDEDRTITFIGVSNLHEGKGLDDAISAFAIARARGFEDWEYRIVGDGAQQRSLIGHAASLGLAGKVRFLGARPRGQIYDLLDTADVFLLPSYREAFGIAYLEAMASGLLTIGVRGQGPQAFIEDGRTGLLVEPRNPNLLADCIVDISQRRAAMRSVAAAGADFVRREFTWEAHARRLIEVYREVSP